MLAFCRRPALRLHSRSTYRLLHSHYQAVSECSLTVTGSTGCIDAFKRSVRCVSESGLAFLPRGIAFLGRETSVLSFQRLLPVEDVVEKAAPSELTQLWGSATDARAVLLKPGWPKAKGRSSLVYDFVTGGGPPLKWLQVAAEAHPSLRFGLKYALPCERAAFEVEYQHARRIHQTQVSYQAWLWNHKVSKNDIFADLKRLLNFPDGRVPKKRKLTIAELRNRLQANEVYTHALELVARDVRGLEDAARRVQSHRFAKLFQTTVLPEFHTWLQSTEGLRLA